MKHPLIHDIFKIPIYEFKLDLDNDKLYNYCKKYQREKSGRVVSNLGGYQSKELDLNEPTLKPILEEIKLHVNTFSNKVLNGLDQTVDNLWFNINRYKDSNLVHNHPNAEISGTYYVKTPDECGQIIFQHPAFDVLSYYSILKGKNSSPTGPYDSLAWNMPVCEGTLYLFPSWLNHRVESNMNKTEDRVSLAFNTHYRGE
jgi:uncharacterized protein (TIGR02466 family)